MNLCQPSWPIVESKAVEPSRIDTLERPRGAGKAPLVVILMVAAVATTAFLVGRSGGWLVALLVPALALTLYIVLNVFRVLFTPSTRR